jgi:alkanesulfonate monooxygenase SsuD/methylene tetrahydromethanopterin reductase-like flavin-dependent oxidoreductase (luciferase family)
VPAALERCGRFADGWLPSACTPAEAAAGRVVIDEAAAAAGRAISPEHFGVSLAYAPGPLEPSLLAALGRSRKGVDPARVVPAGRDALRSFLESFLEVGFSKFVVRPLARPDSWRAELEALAAAVGDLQT